jgi:hypothetical protein
MRLLAAFVFALPLPALDLEVGLKAGVPATAYFDARSNQTVEYSAATRRYTVGASIDWRVAPTLGLGLEALYHRMGYVAIVSSSGAGERTTSAVDVKGHSFDFPLRARWYLGTSRRLFVTGGFLIRYAGPVRGRGELIVEDLLTGGVTRTPVDTTDPPELRKRLYTGFTTGAGVSFGRGRLRVVPEFRYTRWTANLAVAGGLLRFAPHQAEFLLGFEFAP